MNVVYILDTFPKISLTFIQNEILAMKKKGVGIQIVACTKSAEEEVHPQVHLLGKIIYLTPLKRRRKIFAHLFWFLRNPQRYLSVFSKVLQPEFGLRWTFRHHLYSLYLISKMKPDLVHAHFGRVSSDLAFLYSLLTGTPFTFTTHRYDIFERPPQNYPLKSRYARRHITISEFNRRYIVNNFGVEKEQIKIIRSGIDFEREYPACHPEGNNLIAISRLEKSKGLDFLLEACRKLKQDGTIFKCWIVGDGAERESLEKMIGEFGLNGDVVLFGNKTQEEVFKLLSKAKVKVLPSRSESMGVSLMEAMAMRVPVIGPKIYGVPELIDDGQNGFLVAPGDVDALTERIKRLLTDEPLRKRFIERAYEKVKKDFNLVTETDKLLAVWEGR